MNRNLIIAATFVVLILLIIILNFKTTTIFDQGTPAPAPAPAPAPTDEEVDDELEEEPKPWSEYGESDCQAMGTKAWWDNATSTCNEVCYNSSTQCGNETSRNEDGTCAYTGSVCNRSDCVNKGINAEDAPAC